MELRLDKILLKDINWSLPFEYDGGALLRAGVESDGKASILRQFQNSSKLSKRPHFDLIKGAFSAVTLQVAASNYPLQLFANDIFAIF